MPLIRTKRYKGSGLIARYIYSIFPEVDRQLDHWTEICENAGDSVLAEQALDSIEFKRFHAQGGSVYALYPHTDPESTVRFIVALQTISDYLDNLCDRTGLYDEAAFRQLHLAILDAVDPERSISDYYIYYPYKNDNSYLIKLVEACRNEISLLPSYDLVIDNISEYMQLYSDLQTYKHLDKNIRESRILQWACKYQNKYPEISPWEFAAAAGSTLGVFILFAAASDPLLTPREARSISSAYFPWICGLHILLDYYIDLQEDLSTGDLNFTYYYKNLKECEERLSYFVDRALENCRALRFPEFHLTIVQGLLAMYLSDPKASVGLNNLMSGSLIRKGGKKTVFYHRICTMLRHLGKL